MTENIMQRTFTAQIVHTMRAGCMHSGNCGNIAIAEGVMVFKKKQVT